MQSTKEGQLNLTANSFKEIIRDDLRDPGTETVTAMQLVLKLQSQCPTGRGADSYPLLTTCQAGCSVSHVGWEWWFNDMMHKAHYLHLALKNCGHREPTAGKEQEWGISHHLFIQ